MEKVKKTLVSLICSAACFTAAADRMDDARRLVNEGDFWGARQLLDKEASANPRSSNTAAFNYLSGVCAFEGGDYAAARKLLETAKSKGSGAANLYLGRLAFLDYDFPKAQDLYGEFRRYREKAGQVAGEGVEEAERRLMTAENSLGRVEKITVIDSIAVPTDGFYQFYKLPHSAGRILAPFEMPLEKHRDGAVMAFMNEGGDFMMWGEPDSVGNVHLVESLRLTDGNWQEPVSTPSFLNKGGYADYPFMMPDGVTLYYASDGDESMGGYDIFVVSRDPQTGEYLQPQNLGMPFNSPYDDFLLAVDEENGVGWWATDRNHLGDKLTIYVYLVNDFRQNYSADETDILEKARLTDFRSTQDLEKSEEYSELLTKVKSIDPDEVKEAPEFHFPKPGGTYFTNMNDFKRATARQAMKRYLHARQELDKEENRLAALRKRFLVNRADNVKQQIIQFEKEIEQQRDELVRLRSEVYRLEFSKK